MTRSPLTEKVKPRRLNRRRGPRKEMYEVRWLDGMGISKAKRYFSQGNAHEYARKIRTSVIHVRVARIS